MTAPNRNTLWAHALVDELAELLDAVCLAPGSRSSPLALAFADQPDVEVYSHLDERSAGFFALGRGRKTGMPTPLVCTSGTAAANFHPAILEASESRVPLLVLTADRPPELVDSGANQTTDQAKLYGDAVRWYRTLPEPEADARKLRSVRVSAIRAVVEATTPPAGPVHLNVPFRKPLEPTAVPGDVPEQFDRDAPLAASGRAGPFVTPRQGRPHLDDVDVDALVRAIDRADRGLIVCGPANEPTPSREALAELATTTGFPVLADPLSGHRFGPHVTAGGDTTLPSAQICGGYDSYLDGVDWPAPDLVIQFGGSPTSAVTQSYLGDLDAVQVLVDPAGGWREATFRASDLVVADPTSLVAALTTRVKSPAVDSFRNRFARAERQYWSQVSTATGEEWFEGAVVATIARRCPTPANLFVSNSMPVRDLDRFGQPHEADLRVYGNRGVSGIDGITSSALGVASASEAPLVLVIGDLAYYHDMNGLLAIDRCDQPATIVLIDNDGGGIFHKLPIEEYDPPFTDLFKTPHGLDFEATGQLYDLEFSRFEDMGAFSSAFDRAVGSPETHVLATEFDAADSHRFRERLHERVLADRSDWFDDG